MFHLTSTNANYLRSTRRAAIHCRHFTPFIIRRSPITRTVWRRDSRISNHFRLRHFGVYLSVITVRSSQRVAANYRRIVRNNAFNDSAIPIVYTRSSGCKLVLLRRFSRTINRVSMNGTSGFRKGKVIFWLICFQYSGGEVNIQAFFPRINICRGAGIIQRILQVFLTCMCVIQL